VVAPFVLREPQDEREAAGAQLGPAEGATDGVQGENPQGSGGGDTEEPESE
jgi:hypothetical protein